MTKITRYRPHRWLLEDSLAGTVTVKDRADLVRHLKEERSHWPTLENFELSDVTVEKYGIGIDERCGWNTHIVCIKGHAEGFTDGPL